MDPSSFCEKLKSIVEIQAVDHCFNCTERLDIYNYNRRVCEGKTIYFYRLYLYESAMKFPVFELVLGIAPVITFIFRTISGDLAS